jgi:hypothetical protein
MKLSKEQKRRYYNRDSELLRIRISLLVIPAAIRYPIPGNLHHNT